MLQKCQNLVQIYKNVAIPFKELSKIEICSRAFLINNLKTKCSKIDNLQHMSNSQHHTLSIKMLNCHDNCQLQNSAATLSSTFLPTNNYKFSFFIFMLHKSGKNICFVFVPKSKNENNFKNVNILQFNQRSLKYLKVFAVLIHIINS